MYSKLGVGLYDWVAKTTKLQMPKVATPGAILRLEYIPWFSIIGFVTVVGFCVAFGTLFSSYLTSQIVDYDIVLTTQFVESVTTAEAEEYGLNGKASLGEVLDSHGEHTDGMSTEQVAQVKSQFFDHIRALPDLLMANVYTADRVVIWSTNPALIGKIGGDPKDIHEVITRRATIANDYFGGNAPHHSQQHFVADDDTPYFESYIPIMDTAGKVVAVVQVFKQPQSLMQAISQGKHLIWASIALVGIFLYVAPFWILRRADGAIKEQQQRLGEAQTLCVIGEMSASVAHSIRNPLAAIRSSAELALDADPEAARKNAQDIIGQVDRLGKWIRDLLVFSRPVTGERQEIDLVPLVAEFLPNFELQLKQHRIDAEFVHPNQALPTVAGNHALVNQALASIIGNAIEAMPNGGKLRLELQPAVNGKYIDLVVSDSGVGMSAAQLELAYKPFYTTKQNGVGMGVALVKRIMERFGGNIILRSKQGQGTQAHLRFSIN